MNGSSQRKKWLINRDPYNGSIYNPHIIGLYNPLYTVNSQGFFVAHVFSSKFRISSFSRVRFGFKTSSLNRKGVQTF